MELYEEILLYRLKKMLNEELSKETDPAKIVESVCYQTLKKIKAIIEDDSLEDPECFMKIEQIVCVFEDIGSNGGTRHDFG